MSELLEIKNLEVDYRTKRGFTGREQIVHAVNGLSLDVKKGEILAIAGESGCGKSTLAKAIMKLAEFKNGKILYNGEDISKQKTLNDVRNYYNNVQMIFQNPYSSLNPKMKIGDILKEPLYINTKLSRDEINKIVLEKLNQVGLDESVLHRYPHEFSGGQRQRIAIARSLVLKPVSALDVSIQAQIINLIKELKENLNLTFIFVSHDLSVIKYISDRIAVMYLGEIVEFGSTKEIFENPKHPYTQALLSSVPDFNKEGENEEHIELRGELPSVENLPKGCKFHTRCPYVMDECKENAPDDVDFSDSHSCKCFIYAKDVL